MAETDGNPMQRHRLLKLKWCHIDREVTPFQVLSVEANFRMVMLSQFAPKDSKLQYNSSLNVSNQRLATKHKPIRGWHQSVMHWGEREAMKNRTSVWTYICEACVITQPVSAAIVGRLVGCTHILVGVVVRSKGLRYVFVSPQGLSVVISLPFSSLADLHSSKVTGCC